MRRLIQLPRWRELNQLPVMYHVFDELTEGFKDYECEIRVVTSLEELEDGGIIFLDDAAGRYMEQKEIYIEMSKKCHHSVFICWYWDKDDSFKPFQYMIYTGEYYMNKPNDIYHHYQYMMKPDFVPLKLRSNESPQLVGTYPKNIERDYCYMGGGYKMDWIPQSFTGIYHRVIDTNYLSYSERKQIYLSSTFALGFQSDGNIQTGHLSQRIFEGLTYGCIVFCENPLASIFTNNIVVHITSKEDLINKMNYYKNHPEEILDKQQKGYEWVKKYGTNRLTIQNILHKIQSLFHLQFITQQYKDTKINNINMSITEEKDRPIVSVNIMGGLGNQLFQIATAYAYAKKENATLQIQHILSNGKRPVYWNTLLTKLQPYLVNTLPSLPKWSEDLPTMYKEIIPLPPQGLFLSGYLQSSKYFYNNIIKNEIKDLFRPNQEYLEDIINKYKYLLDHREKVIVIHARRTDYLQFSEVHGPLTYDYYQKAIHHMISNIQNPIFLLTSDDNHFWNEIRHHIPILFSNPHIILDNESDIHTYTLLQQFNHFIMSNSTFIWWCVYMADAKNVIAPSQWFGPKGPSPFHDIFENNWILL